MISRRKILSFPFLGFLSRKNEKSITRTLKFSKIIAINRDNFKITLIKCEDFNISMPAKYALPALLKRIPHGPGGMCTATTDELKVGDYVNDSLIWGTYET